MTISNHMMILIGVVLLVVAVIAGLVALRAWRRAEAEAMNRWYIERQRRETLRKAAGQYQPHNRRRES